MREPAKQAQTVGGNAMSKSGTPDATVIVVSFNTRELTLACLQSVLDENKRLHLEIVVVDNASQDGSADAIRERFPHIRLISSSRNLGFAAANNLAATDAKGRYIVLLNPDTIVLESAIDQIVEFADSEQEVSIVGGRTLNSDRTLNPSSCWGAPSLWSLFCEASLLATLFRGSRIFDPTSLGAWQRDSVREVDVVSGCFLLIPRKTWEHLGGFDEQFFMYGEDVDLSLRASRHGPRPRISPNATVVHVGAASEPVREDKLVRLMDGQRRIIRTHWSPRATGLGLSLHSLGAFIRAAAARVLGSVPGRDLPPSWAAWAGAWRRRKEWQ